MQSSGARPRAPITDQPFRSQEFTRHPNEDTHFPLLNPGPGAIHRAEIEFSEEAWNQTNHIVDELGNIWESNPAGYQFAQGAKKYLGLSLKRSGNDLTFSAEDTSVETKFLKRFTPEVTMRQTIVTGSGSTDTRDVVIDRTYAKAVFDAAVDIIKNTNFDIGIDKKQRGAAQAKETIGDDNIDINPLLYGRYHMYESVARAYDGFWVLLHEMFHLAGADRYETLAKARSKSVKDATTGDPVQESGDNDTWKGDYVGQTAGGDAPRGSGDDPGPVVSLVNILRFGSKLPIRTMYGQTLGSRDDSYVAIEFADYDTATSSWERAHQGVIRKDLDSTLDKREYASGLVELNTEDRVDDLWTDRLQRSRIQVSVDAGDFQFEVSTAKRKNRVAGRSFGGEIDSGSATLQFNGNWRTALAGRARAGLSGTRGGRLSRWGTLVWSCTRPMSSAP